MASRHRYGQVSEAAIVTALGHWFSARGWECYPELDADLTVYHRTRDVLLGIEAKKELNFKVLNQALQHRHRGRHDAVVVCTSGYGSTARFWGPRVCGVADIGLGLITVENCHCHDVKIYGAPQVEVLLRAPPASSRDAARKRILELMCPEAQVYATPGASGPQSFTSFRMWEVELYRECLKGPLLIDEARALLTKGKKKVDLKRFLSWFGPGAAFGTLEIKAEHVMIRAPWGTKEAGHSGITWAPPDPVLVAQPCEVLATKIDEKLNPPTVSAVST